MLNIYCRLFILDSECSCIIFATTGVVLAQRASLANESEHTCNEIVTSLSRRARRIIPFMPRCNALVNI